MQVLKYKKVVTIFTLSLIIFLIVRGSILATNLTNASLRLDRMTTSNIDTKILVVIKPASTATEAKIKVSMATGFTVDTIASNITTSTTSLPSTYQGQTLTAWPTIGATATSVTGQYIVFSSGDLTAGTLYGFFITAGVDNPSSTGNYESTLTTLTSTDVNIDTSNVANAIVSNDQVVITATVPATLSCTLSANTDTFTADLSPSSIISTNGITYTIATNDSNGWIAWLKSANAGLTSPTTGETIITTGSVDDTPSTLTTGTNGYVLDTDITNDSATGDGTVTIDAEYNGLTTSAGGTLNNTALEEIATSNGTTDNDILTIYGRTSISAVTAAAVDYTDTWDIVCSGNF